MSKLVGVSIAAELLDTTISSLQVTACNYKKEHGAYPKWYIADGKVGGSKSYVDMEVIASARALERASWIHCTDYLFWWLTDWMELSQNKLANEMAKRSKVYTNRDSWASFFSGSLFNLPKENIYSNHRTMTQEFTIYGTAMALAYYRDNYL